MSQHFQADRDDLQDQLLLRRQALTDALTNLPYDFLLYLDRAIVHSNLACPDLAAGDAYRALLLTDEVLNDGYEYHQQAVDCLREHTLDPLPSLLNFGVLLPEGPPAVAEVAQSITYERVAQLASVRCYQILSVSLLLVGCLKPAAEFCERGLAISPDNQELLDTLKNIGRVAKLKSDRQDMSASDYPEWGLARREVYQWNDHEPDRYSAETIEFLNKELAEAAPKCMVGVTELPVLLDCASSTDHYDIIPTTKQLGLFAKADIAPGELVLEEYSLLTASNRLKDPVCDACSNELPPLGSNPGPISCSDCDDTVFCSQFCYTQAIEKYHPAICEKDVDAIARGSDAKQADEALHLLLLARVLAMAAHQQIHPLELKDVKYIWGDFVPSAANDIDSSQNAGPPPDWTLPFHFDYNIKFPLHFLEKMDVDIYQTLANYDLWVINTLFAKFRGTASARKDPRDGRPDVAAVHPLWCLANHDCDSNVTWEWAGRMSLIARQTRVVGNNPGTIRRGEEILNHYCDVTLPVQDRREWARGSLGGWCMCNRCRSEASSQEGTPKE